MSDDILVKTYLSMLLPLSPAQKLELAIALLASIQLPAEPPKEINFEPLDEESAQEIMDAIEEDKISYRTQHERE